jgi:hypothetical protein
MRSLPTAKRGNITKPIGEHKGDLAMRNLCTIFMLFVVTAFSVSPAHAARAAQKRENADYVLSGMVFAVYSQETQGYNNYIVEIKVESVEKGDGIKKGDYFRAFCYQPRQGGTLGVFDDHHGHKIIPKEGRQVKMFVNRAGGRNEGVYPDWVDILSDSAK